MQRFNSLLNKPELIALNARIQETQVVQKIWEDVAPGNLAQLSRAVSLKNQQFSIVTDNNAVAAKIKLLIPSLLIKLEKRGCEVTSIRVKVQVKSASITRSKPVRKLSNKAATSLQPLAKKLSGTDLGTVLARLVKKAG